MPREQQPTLTRQVGLRWTGVHDVHPEFIDQIGVGLGAPAGVPAVPDSIVMTLGRVQQPFLVGGPEDIARQAEAIESIDIVTVGRFLMSRERAEELRNVLTTAINQYDAARVSGAES